jgi:membrane protease subunit HflK
VVPEGPRHAARLLQEAEGYKPAVVATAQGDASRFRQILAEYKKAPQVTRERLYLDAMQQILSSTSKVIVDQKGGQQPAVPAARQA